MKKSPKWMFRCVSALVSMLMISGAGGPVLALPAVPAAALPEPSLPVMSSPQTDRQSMSNRLVTQPLTPTVTSSVTVPDQSTDAATIDKLLAPSAPDTSCTVNPQQFATLFRKDEIVALGPDNHTRYTQANNYAWGSVSNALSTGLTDPPAIIARDRVIEWIVNKGGTLYHGRAFPDRSSLTTAPETSLGSPQPGGWGQPALVERTPFEMWTFIRGGNNDTHLYYKVWQDGKGWSPNWTPIPNVNDAGSIPVVVFRDENHLDVFYKDSANSVKFTEWAFGEWMPQPISLDTGGPLASDLNAVSPNANQVDVFGVSAAGNLWVRQWTADKQPDWSDVPVWQKIASGVRVEKPAVAALSGDQMVVAFRVTSTNNYSVFKYSKSSWAGVALLSGYGSGYTTLPALAKTNANTYMVVGSTSGGPVAYIDSGGVGSFTNDNPPATGDDLQLVTWEPGEVVLLGRNTGNSQLNGAAYTAYGRNQSWQTITNFTPMSFQPFQLTGQDRYALAKVNNTPYLVWLETTNTNEFRLKSRKNPLTSATDDQFLSLDPGPIAPPALMVKDLNGDGNDKVIVFYRRVNGVGWLKVIDPATFAQTSINVPELPEQIMQDSPFISVAAGDLDGDGKPNDIAVAFVNFDSALDVVVFHYDGVQLNKIAERTWPVSQDLYHSDRRWIVFGESTYVKTAADVSLVIDHFDPNVNHDVLVIGTTNIGWRPALETRLAELQLSGGTLSGEFVKPDFSRPIPGTDRGFRSWTPNRIQLAAVDLNGDGTKEIAAFYVVPDSQKSLVVYKAPSFTKLSQLDGVLAERMAVGDLKGDGLQEIVGATHGALTVYKQKAGATTGTLQQVFQDTTSNLSDGEFFVDDINNDSVTVVQDGCADFRDVKPLFVLNAPPRWYPSQGAGVSYGKSNSAGTGSGSTSSVKLGASLTVGFEYEQDAPLIGTKIGGVRASVTQDFAYTWEKSRDKAETNTWSKTYQFDTGAETPGPTGIVVFEQTKYRCYFFRLAREPGGTHSVKSCVHLGVGTTGLPVVSQVSLDQWRSADFKTSAGANWADVGSPTNAMTDTITGTLTIPGYLKINSVPASHFPVVTNLPSALMQDDVFPSATSVQWDNTKDTTYSTSGSWEENTTTSAGFTAGTFKLDASFTVGAGGGATSSETEGNGETYGAVIYSYVPLVCQVNNISCQPVNVQPYIYLHTVADKGGQTYAVHELDYYVTPYVPTANPTAPKRQRPTAPQAAPLTPVITSTTHPDPNTWYPTSTVTLNWAQPASDHAVISGYAWNTYPQSGNTPTSFSAVPTQTTTYTGVEEGISFFTLVAKDDNGQLSPVAERQVLVDTRPPSVTLDLNPITTYNGWYNQPVTVTVTADDGAGSGVASVEYSLNGTTWLSYTTPLVYNTNLLTTTVWAHATDALGHVSDAVSTTFKIDMLPPNSVDRDGYGLSYGGVLTTNVGNYQVILGGQLTDTGSIQSGPANMLISTDELPDYRSIDAIGSFPMPPDNLFPTTETSLSWIYTPTFATHGSYDILGYGVDAAGNQETPYGLGVFSWDPTGAPDLGQTLITSDDDGAYAGDIVTFTIAVRNSGTGESHLIMTNTVPSGLTVLPESITGGGQYITASNAIVWRYGTAWPGETGYLNFSAQVNVSPVTTTTLQNILLLHPYYPATTSQSYTNPPEQVTTGTLVVLPTPTQQLRNAPLAPDASLMRITTPRVLRSFVMAGGSFVIYPDTQLFIQASPSTSFVHIREYTLTVTGTWALAQESGWIPFVSSAGVLTVTNTGVDLQGVLNWTLSPGDGVKMLEVTAANSNKQVSSANAGNISYTNLMSPFEQTTLAQGQTVQYRVNLGNDIGQITWWLDVSSGDADVYAWSPRSSEKPNYYSTGSGVGRHTMSFGIEEAGTYIIEVHAYTDATTYQLTLGVVPPDLVQLRLPQHPTDLTRLPAHPLTRTIPLFSAPLANLVWRTYLPVIRR